MDGTHSPDVGPTRSDPATPPVPDAPRPVPTFAGQPPDTSAPSFLRPDPTLSHNAIENPTGLPQEKSLTERFHELPIEAQDGYRQMAAMKQPLEMAELFAEEGLNRTQARDVLKSLYPDSATDPSKAAAIEKALDQTAFKSTAGQPEPVPFTQEQMPIVDELGKEAQDIMKMDASPEKESRIKKLFATAVGKLGGKTGDFLMPLAKTVVIGGSIFAVILLFFFLMHASKK